MNNAQAGPSRTSDADTGYTPAPLLTLPPTTYCAVEYPGILRSLDSYPHALATLGGQDAVDTAFRRLASGRPMELYLRPEDKLAHPILGEVLEWRGMVVKVVKRRRKRKRPEGENTVDGEIGNGKGREKEEDEDGGVYTTEVLGMARKIARFRAMADFAFSPPEDEPIMNLRKSMDNLDAKAILAFEFKPVKEDYVVYPPGVSASPAPGTTKGASSDPSAQPTSNLRLFPPPRFSRAAVPALYNSRKNIASIPVTVTDPTTGEERTRYQNKFRHSATPIATISYDAPDVPEKEPEGAEKVLDQPSMRVLEKLRKLFEERPIWSRLALKNQLSEAEDQILVNTRPMYAYTGYIFSDGPWRDFHVKWGYDPRKIPESRIYQRMQFRNLENEYTRASSVRFRRANGEEDLPMEEDWRGITLQRNRNTHIFNGRELFRNVGNYQLCDMTDPLLQKHIHDPNGVDQECDASYGWYTPTAWGRIRAIARLKFRGLVEGRILTDAECEDIETEELPEIALRNELRRSAGQKKLRELRQRGLIARSKGHNQALEPLPPEEEAEQRIRKRLEAARAEDEDEDMD
ncbi:hypothetical protein DACRYDRAFT_73628 [Dacryopinax primogenitus]|uniref:Transcription factor IIIC subunit 5 HTH domain-containing protein n=1 Tax=Dacryopinax primogenitus (strain DJM 731) TaxID=1858805 RepID=M5GCJ6_DACPD|nr:uncharacterized protein DACRYDRAFT_73628 [Dacryopinax primogenitus]EJU06250.1 hypothetical protein DACRYDRAFT_73628 [Dacryopinax primogenitus]